MEKLFGGENRTLLHEQVAPSKEALPGGANGVAFKDPAFAENKTAPIHRWVPWIAGFSAGFVADCLREYLPGVRPSDALVLDPFAGVGTTCVEAYRRGYNTVGFEINPYAALAARSKLEAAEVSLPALETFASSYQHFMKSTAEAGSGATVAPPGFRSRIPFFSPSIESQVLRTLEFIQGIGDPKVRDLFLVAFGSVMVKFSNYTYEPSLTTRPGSGKALIEKADVPSIVGAKLQEIIDDCRVFQTEADALGFPREQRIVQDTIFNADQYLAAGSVDLAVTSPPYLNNYHYIRNTRPHLFWLSFIESSTDLKQIEHASFGKFWQTVRDGERLSLAFEMPELAEVIDQIRELNVEKGIYGGSGWANYAAQYFNDTYRLCEVMERLLRPGGRIVVVIGNSILQGVEIKVEEFLARIGERCGLVRENIHMLRTKRVGNSIIRSSVRNGAVTKATLYEVAVVLRKSGG